MMTSSSDFTHPRHDSLLIKVLRGERVARPPAWFMRQAGRYLPEFRELRRQQPDFMQFCQSEELTCRAALQPFDRYELDAAIVFADILTIPAALGMDLTFIPGTGPVFSQPLSPLDWRRELAVTGIQERLGYVSQNVATLRRELPESIPLIGFSGCPWTLLAYMLTGRSQPGFPDALQTLADHPKDCQAILTLLSDIIVEYLLNQVSAGADVLMLFDTWAGCLPGSIFADYAADQLGYLIHKLKLHTNTPIILFGKGCNQRLPTLATTGADALGVDFSSSLQQARADLPSDKKDIVLQGNFNPELLLGDKSGITEAVESAFRDFDPHHAYIANLGHGIIPEADPELVQHWLQEVRRVSAASG